MTLHESGSRTLPSTAPNLHFVPAGASGLFARTGALGEIVNGLNSFISSHYRNKEMEVFEFTPVMSRAHLEKMGYFRSFPQLAGCVCCLSSGTHVTADTADITSFLPSAFALTPAACYQLYPTSCLRTCYWPCKAFPPNLGYWRKMRQSNESSIKTYSAPLAAKYCDIKLWSGISPLVFHEGKYRT